MKVTFVTPHINISGGVKALLEYSNRLAERGHDVTLITLQPSSNRREVLKNKAKVPLYNLFKVKPDWIDMKPKIKYVNTLKEEDFPDSDILVTTGWQNTHDVSGFSERKGVKFWLVQHFEKLSHSKKEEGSVLDGLYRGASKKIVISQWIKGILKNDYSQDSDIIVTPVDLEVFSPRRREHKSLRLCMLHHFIDWKGVEDGLKAVKIVKQRFPEVKLVMYGVHHSTGPELCDEYHHRISPDKVAELFNSCDVYVCPSWYEGLGMPSMEAMACQTALATTDNGGSRDYAFHGKTALVSPPKKPEKMAENIIKLIQDKELRERLAANGCSHVKKFTWEKAAKAMEEIFEKQI